MSSETKDMVLQWIEHCLLVNSGRGGLWNIEAGELHAMSFVSDGFMLNLCSILLQLSLPFVSEISDNKQTELKVLKVSFEQLDI